MKQGWKYGTLENVVKKASSNISLNKIQDENGKYPVYGAQGIVKNVSFYQQEKNYLAVIKDGAGIGRISKHPAKSSVLATMQYIIPNKEYHIDFVRYFLESLDFEKYRTGSTIPHIYFKDYKKAKFPLVEEQEQKQIVAILDKAFAAIDQAKANIEKNIENAKELFQSKLNEVFSQKGDDWEEKKLVDICDIKPQKKIAKEKLKEEDLVSFVPMNCLGIDQIYFSSEESKKLKEVYSGYVYFEEGDVVLAKITPCFENGKLGIAKNLVNGIGFGSSEYVVYRPNNTLIPEFLYFFLNRETLRIKGKALMSGAVGHKRIQPSFYENETLYLPSIEEQSAICKKVIELQLAIEKTQNNYRIKQHDLEDLKKSLLQKAFSGELTGKEVADKVSL